MNRYVFNGNGIFTGCVLSLNAQDTFPSLSTTIAPPALSAGEFARWNGGGWDVVTELPAVPVAVPQRVTMRQFQLALIDDGSYDAVVAFIDTLTGTEKKKALVEWNGAYAERVSPSINAYGAVLGMTEEDIDNIFIMAAGQ